MDIPRVDEDAILDALYNSRPFRAARLLLGSEKLKGLSEDLPTAEAPLTAVSNPDTLARNAEAVSNLVLEAIQNQSKQAALQQTGYGTVPIAEQTSPKDQAEVNLYRPKNKPTEGTAPAPPGTQYGTKLAYVDEAAIAAMGYAPDIMALASGNTDRDDRFLSPNQALSLGGAATAAYMLNNLRSNTQARKLLAGPASRYVELVEKSELSPEALKLINKELSMLGVPGKLVHAENKHIAEAALKNISRNLERSITGSRIKAVAPVAASAALASLIYNNLAPRSIITGERNAI